MSDSTHDLLVRGIAAAKAGEAKEARFYLEWLLRSEAPLEERIDAWYFLSEISQDPKEQRDCLEEILANDPTDGRARRKLAILDGRLNPAEIVDPDRLGVPAAPGAQDSDAQRFTCPQCGGRMTYTPDGQSLVCEYCESRRRLGQSGAGGSGVKSQDFLVALATAKGHLHPVTTRTFDCQGCGASFVLPPEKLSLTCPYCGSAYVIEQSETRELSVPDGLAPFETTQAQAAKALQAWIAAEVGETAEVRPLQGWYAPVWCFDVGGTLPWSCLRYDGEHWMPDQGLHLVSCPGLLIPATPKLPEVSKAALREFSLDGLASYDPAYLADWPAETYQISLADASLDAREQALQRERQHVSQDLQGRVKDVNLSTTGILIESYRLLLLPFWISHYTWDGASHPVLINGQNGRVYGERPKRGLGKWLEELLF